MNVKSKWRVVRLDDLERRGRFIPVPQLQLRVDDETSSDRSRAGAGGRRLRSDTR
jgi:hypothetical protein